MNDEEKRKILAQRASRDSNEVTNEELLEIILSLHNSNSILTKLNEDEIIFIKKLYHECDDEDFKDIKELLRNRRFVIRLLYLIRTIIISASATIVAYNVLYDTIVDILKGLHGG